MVFDAYLAAADGDPSGLAIFNLVGPMMLPTDRWILGEYFNKGGTIDSDKYRGIESISPGNSIMGAPFSEFAWPMAKEWPVELISKDLREFQESDVEMLLVNGTVGFSTPPTALDEARPFYHKAQMVLLLALIVLGVVSVMRRIRKRRTIGRTVLHSVLAGFGT